MSDNSDRLYRTATLILFCVLLLVAGTAILWGIMQVPELVNERTAAWVQGIGSILAVGAAAWVAIYQKRNADQQAKLQRLEARVEKLSAIHAIAVATYELIERLEQAFLTDRAGEYFDEEYSADAFLHAQSALKAIPLHELGSYNMVAGILDLSDALACAIRFSCEHIHNPNNLTAAEKYEVYIRDFAEKARDGYRDVQSDSVNAKIAHEHARKC